MRNDLVGLLFLDSHTMASKSDTRGGVGKYNATSLEVKARFIQADLEEVLVSRTSG